MNKVPLLFTILLNFCIFAVADGRSQKTQLREIATPAVNKSVEDLNAEAMNLLRLCLGEPARRAAMQATIVDPRSAAAYKTLGWVLEHDFVGRHLTGNFDYEGALAAYRKAKELDPDDTDLRQKLFDLLLYNKDGVQFAEDAPLLDAAREWVELAALDESKANERLDNLSQSLWYAHKDAELLEELKPYPSNVFTDKLRTACIAELEGAEAAIKNAKATFSTDEKYFNEVLYRASWYLAIRREYKLALALLNEAGEFIDEDGGANVARFRDELSRTVNHEDLPYGSGDPRSAFVNYALTFTKRQVTTTDLDSVFARVVFAARADRKELLSQELYGFRWNPAGYATVGSLRSVGLSAYVDRLLSNTQYTVENRDEVSRVVVKTPYGPATTYFTITENGVAKMSSDDSAPLGLLILGVLKKGRLDTAMTWTKWVLETVPGHTDSRLIAYDPLYGPALGHLFQQGVPRDPERLRIGAISMLRASKAVLRYLPEVESRYARARGARRLQLALVLADLYDYHGLWTKLDPLTAELLKIAPTSGTAFRFRADALLHTKKLQELRKLLRDNPVSHYPDDILRSRARMHNYLGEYAEASADRKIVMNSPQGSNEDINSFAWSLLFWTAPKDDVAAGLQRLRQVVATSEYRLSNWVQTLACLDAQSGESKEIPNLLQKYMDQNEDRPAVPDSSLNLALAWWAERNGQSEFAEELYERVEKPTNQFELNDSPYELATRRLKVLQSEKTSSASAH